MHAPTAPPAPAPAQHVRATIGGRRVTLTGPQAQLAEAIEILNRLDTPAICALPMAGTNGIFKHDLVGSSINTYRDWILEASSGPSTLRPNQILKAVRELETQVEQTQRRQQQARAQFTTGRRHRKQIEDARLNQARKRKKAKRRTKAKTGRKQRRNSRR